VKEVADLFSESAKDAGMALEVSLQENIPDIKFDEKQLREVLINLSQNALKSMKSGGSLKIKTLLIDGNVIIRVTDTGDGIPEQNIEKIFSPFFSTREGGLGLGLSIVQRIVESHGGKIICQSKIGEGTTFEVLLPVERESF
jgi:signal transduction histidine kinase